MKILRICTFVMISGILSSIVAANEGTEEPPDSGKGVPRHVFVLGYVNTTVEDIDKFDTKLCEQNGGANTYDEHVKSRKQYDSCTDSLYTEVRQEVEEYGETSWQAREENYFEIYCRKVTRFGNCLKNFTDSMKTCLDATKHESADIVHRTAVSVTQFVCQDKGTRIGKFITGGGSRCVDSKASAVQECADQTIIKYIHSIGVDGSAIGGLGKLHLLVPDSTKCNILQKYGVCIVNTLKSCPEPTPDLVHSVFNLVKKSTTCDRFITSKASSPGMADVLAMIALMATSLRFL